MYARKIFNRLSLKELQGVSKCLHKYFPLVSTKRILNLILQVDSIDITLMILCLHRECSDTIDTLVYDYLLGKDSG